jgi:protein SCO1
MSVTGLRYLFGICAIVLLLAGAWPLAAHHGSSSQDGEKKPHQSPPEKVLSPAHTYFTDVVLVNQHGEKMRLYRDVLKGKVVIIGSFFTSCEGSCPVVMGTFARLQDWLGERLKNDVHLVSVTVDPSTDTPAELKAYANKLHAKPGWYFLTGPKQNVDFALYKLGQYVEAKESHRNIIIIGNESTGLWKKTFGLAGPNVIIPIVEGVLRDQGS